MNSHQCTFDSENEDLYKNIVNLLCHRTFEQMETFFLNHHATSDTKIIFLLDTIREISTEAGIELSLDDSPKKKKKWKKKKKKPKKDMFEGMTIVEQPEWV